MSNHITPKKRGKSLKHAFSLVHVVVNFYDIKYQINCLPCSSGI